MPFRPNLPGPGPLVPFKSRGSAGVSVSVTPSAVVATATVPTPTVSAIRNASVTPSAVIAARTIPTPGASGKASVTPSAVIGTRTIPTPTVSGAANVTPATVVATAVFPTAAVVAQASVTPSAKVATATFPTPLTTAAARAPPTAVVAAATFPTPVASGDASVDFLDPPTGLTATPISPTRIDLSWDAVSGVLSPTYSVMRDGAIIVTGLTNPTYSDTSGLTEQTQYAYRVKANGTRWTPPQLPALTHWPKANDIPGLQDNDNIPTWPDKTPNGWDFTGGSDKPKWRTNVVGGKAVARFYSPGITRQVVYRNFTSGLHDLMTFTLSFVVKLNTNQNLRFFFVNNDGAFGGWYVQDNSSNSLRFRTFGASSDKVVDVTTTLTDAFHVVVIRVDDSAKTIRVWKDGGTALADTTYTSSQYAANNSELMLVGSGQSFSEGIDGDIAEWVIDSTALSNADLNSLGAYYHGQYGTAWTTVT